MCRKNICINQETQAEAHQKGNSIIFEYVETRIWNLSQGEPRWNLQKEHLILSSYQEKMEFGDREWVKSVKPPSGCFHLTVHYHETVCSVS